MLSDETPEPLLLRPNRRRLWWAVGIFAAGFVAVLAVVTYSDAKPPEVSDLTVTPLRIPETENFYLQLMKLEKGLERNEIVPWSEPDDLPAGSPDRMPDIFGQECIYEDFADFLAAGKGWTPSRLAQWDAALAKLATDCEALAGLERGQAPLPTKAWADLDDPYHVGPKLCAAAGMYWHADEARRAMEIFELVHELGDKIKASRGTLSTYRSGMVLNEMALRGLRRMSLREPGLAPELHRWWQGKRDREPAGLLVDALRVQYTKFSLDLDGLCAGTMPAPMPHVFEFCYRSRVLFPLVLKPNLTKALYSESLRNVIGWRDLPSADFKSRSGIDSAHLELGDLARPANLYGRYILYENNYPAALIWRRSLYRSEVSVFETVLALRLYHSEQGRLPASLAELVPVYFPSVPLDYQDGAPIRYSSNARAVWSAGERNLKIVSPDQKIGRNEIFCRLDFAAPPVQRTSPTAVPEP